MAFVQPLRLFEPYGRAVETDRRAVEALAAALEGSRRPLVIVSGTLMVANPLGATERVRRLVPKPSGRDGAFRRLLGRSG